MQEKSGAWPNGQTPLCLQSERSWFQDLFSYKIGNNQSRIFVWMVPFSQNICDNEITEVFP